MGEPECCKLGFTLEWDFPLLHISKMPSKTIKKTQPHRTERLLSDPQVYRAKVDSKHRIVLRSAKYEYYNIYEREDGSAILIPQIVKEVPLSRATLKMIDAAVKNMKQGIASKRIDLDAILSQKRVK